MSTRLRLTEFGVVWGGTPGVAGISLSVEPGEIIGVFGHNGAGKSSLLLGVAGLAPECSGSVRLDEEVLDGRTASQRATLGVGSSLQGGRVFPDLTVAENLRLAAHPITVQDERSVWRQRLIDAFPVLGVRRDTVARNLSGGERQILATTMGLVRRPRLLLLDEPLTGLSRGVATMVLELVSGWAATSGCAVLLVEQRFEEALGVSSRWIVLADGRAVATAKVTTSSVSEVTQAIASGPDDLATPMN